MVNPEAFDLEGLTLQQLRYFNAVAEGETFADAAALIGISQSALSQGIARLEQVTRSRLLERDGRRRRLTETGELVAAYARRILGESETLASQLHARRAGAVGRLRVGMIDAAVLYLFTHSIRSFRKDHPGVTLSISVAGSAELEQRLSDFRDDVAIVVGPTEREARQLLTEPLHLYGPDGSHGLTHALYPQGSRTRTAIDVGLASAGIEANVIAESANPAVLRELCRLTGSLTVLPEPVAAAADEIRVLRRNVAERAIVGMVRDRATAPPLALEFLDRLRERLPVVSSQ